MQLLEPILMQDIVQFKVSVFCTFVHKTRLVLKECSSCNYLHSQVFGLAIAVFETGFYLYYLSTNRLTNLPKFSSVVSWQSSTAQPQISFTIFMSLVF